MLFKIENCKPSNYHNQFQKQLALSNILRSHGLGNNIVISDVETIDEIISSEIYGHTDKLFAQDILSSRREHTSLIDQLTIHLIIDFNCDKINTSTHNEHTIIRAGYNYFIDSENTGATSLLTENTLDFEFYEIISKYFSNNHSTAKVPIKFRECLGAGSHSKQEFDRLSNQQKLTLCLIDNDKKHPQGEQGSTSGAFTAEDKQINGMQLAHVIDVREVECLIPAHLIEEVLIRNSSNKIDTIDEIKSYNNNNPLFRVYFDHKEGLTLKKAIELDNDHGNFWLDILSTNHRFSSKECFNDKYCNDCGQCPSISGLGDSLLRNIINLLKSYNLRKLNNTVDEYLVDHWYKIGMLLLSWGCSNNERPVRS